MEKLETNQPSNQLAEETIYQLFSRIGSNHRQINQMQPQKSLKIKTLNDCRELTIAEWRKDRIERQIWEKPTTDDVFHRRWRLFGRREAFGDLR